MRSIVTRTLVSLLCVMPILGACSNDEQANTSSTLEARDQANPVVVVMGGYSSCVEDENEQKTPRGSARWVRAEEISARYARGAARWVRTCFDKWGWLYYVTSNQPNIVQYTSLDDPRPFFDAIQTLTEGQGDLHPVYLLGHSHGGWLGMYATWYLPATSKVRMLYTVDPISPAHCTPINYVAALAQPSNSGTFLAGCRRAPTDFTVASRQTINMRLMDRGWRHYYQQNFSPLHSGLFEGSAQPAVSYDVSSFLGSDGTRPSWNAHSGIDDLDLIWTSFGASIGNDLGR